MLEHLQDNQNDSAAIHPKNPLFNPQTSILHSDAHFPQATRTCRWVWFAGKKRKPLTTQRFIYVVPMGRRRETACCVHEPGCHSRLVGRIAPKTRRRGLFLIPTHSFHLVLVSCSSPFARTQAAPWLCGAILRAVTWQNGGKWAPQIRTRDQKGFIRSLPYSLP